MTFHQTDAALVGPVASNTLSDQSTVSGIQMITNNNIIFIIIIIIFLHSW